MPTLSSSDMMARFAALIIVAAVLGTSCSSDSTPASVEPIFGTEDTTCTSVTTRNEDDDVQIIASAVDCLFAEIEAGRPVTVDIAALSAEGDPIYYRYAYDGERVLVVEDNRADEFGRPNVTSLSCARLERTGWVPERFDCLDADHDGFPEAVR